MLKGDDVKGGLTVSDTIGKLKTLTSKGKHLQDTFGFVSHDDISGICSPMPRSGAGTLSGKFGTLRKFGLMMREDFSTVSASIGDNRGPATDTVWLSQESLDHTRAPDTICQEKLEVRVSVC